MRVRIASSLITCVALLVCAWFGLSVRQARDIGHATAIVTQSRPPTAEQLSHAAGLLSSAETLNPDSEVNLVLASVARLQGDSGLAVRILKDVVHDEPQNLAAWDQLAAFDGRDQRTLFRALGEINKLDPPPPRQS